MKHVHNFEDYIFESELNELALTSAGVKELLSAIYYNWDKIKTKMKDEYYFKSFKDVIAYVKGGNQEDQQELTNVVKGLGVEILAF
jgi:hypothetical protein